MALAETGLSFLFVNDGSTDSTETILEALKEEHPDRIGLLSLERNNGKAEAVRRGILQGLCLPYDYIGYWDADLATPLETIAEFRQVLDTTDAEVVIGSRVRLLGRRIERRAFRHYLGRVFATCASLLLGMKVYDTQCGAKLFRRSDILEKVFQKPFKVVWTFDVEMMARFAIMAQKTGERPGSRWHEYPLTHWVDTKGSKVKSSDFVKGAIEFGILVMYLATPLRRIYERSIFDLKR